MTDYPFDLLATAAVGSFDPALLDQRPFVTRAARAIVQGTAHEREAPDYKPSPELRTAINTAIALGQPLLLTGAPGTGKTQAAHWIAWRLALGRAIEFQVKSTSTSRDLLYEFEAVRYMAAAMRATGDPPPREQFVLRRALWEAFVSDHPRVVLVDEIDKAPRDFPNDLLREFDQWVIEVDEAREGDSAGRRIIAPPNRRPIVVITSNGERPLPDPFLRRCIFHHIALKEGEIRDILMTRRDAGDFHASDDLIKTASEIEGKLRGRVERPPGIAELLSWLGLLDVRGIKVVDEAKPLPNLEVLLKTDDDQKMAARK